MPAQPPMTIPQVADVLQITTDTVRKMLAEGRFVGAAKLDPQAQGSPWRIPRSALVPWCGSEIATEPLASEARPAAPTPAPPSPVAAAMDERQAEILEAHARARIAGGGLSRETLAAIASGADVSPDTRPTVSGTHRNDESFVATDSPSGTVRPAHNPEGPTQPAVVPGIYREPRQPHPSEAYRTPELARELAAERDAAGAGQTSQTITTDYADRPVYVGKEAPPFDGDSFGAGPSSLPALPADDPGVHS